ncbi:hypothetical protein D9M69_682200 [compost metagenome]
MEVAALDFTPYAKPNAGNKPGGSELARDSGGSVNIDVGCYALIASKLAPTRICIESSIARHPEIGAFPWPTLYPT